MTQPWKHGIKCTVIAILIAIIYGCATRPWREVRQVIVQPHPLGKRTITNIVWVPAGVTAAPEPPTVPHIVFDTLVWDWKSGNERITNYPHYFNRRPLEFGVEYAKSLGQWQLLGYTRSNSMRVPTNLSQAYFRVFVRTNRIR